MTTDYVIVQVEAWHRDSTHPNGLDYVAAHDLVTRVQTTALGRLYADEGQHVKAIEVYNEAIQRMPPHYQPQVNIMITYN